MNDPPTLFDGLTLDAVLDHARLGRQMEAVKALMADGVWRTLAEIRARAGGSEPGVSARLRDLRKEKFGGHTVNRRRRGNPADGLHEYQLILNAGAT